MYVSLVPRSQWGEANKGLNIGDGRRSLPRATRCRKSREIRKICCAPSFNRRDVFGPTASARRLTALLEADYASTSRYCTPHQLCIWCDRRKKVQKPAPQRHAKRTSCTFPRKCQALDYLLSIYIYIYIYIYSLLIRKVSEKILIRALRWTGYTISRCAENKLKMKKGLQFCWDDANHYVLDCLVLRSLMMSTFYFILTGKTTLSCSEPCYLNTQT